MHNPADFLLEFAAHACEHLVEDVEGEHMFFREGVVVEYLEERSEYDDVEVD